MRTGKFQKLALKIIHSILLLALPASAAVIRVPQNQPTISAAVIAATNNDTVLVALGTYTENVIINGKNLKVLSEAGPAVTTIIPATGNLPVIRILNTGSSMSFEGFTIQNGGSGDGLASGIRLTNSSATIRNNIFRNNNGTCVSLGVGLWADGGSPTIVENVFRGNSGCGRTIEFVNSNALLLRNLIIENSAYPVIFVVGNITAINNTLARNVSTSTGIELNGGSAGQRITNNIIADNTGYGIANAGSQTIISYNDIFNNGAGPISGGVLGPGNLNTDPIFIGGSPFDYHLQLNSPCVDAGDPSTDVPPFGGARVDMGAFEFQQSPGLIAPRGIITLKKPRFVWSQLQDSNGVVVPASYRAILASSCDFNLADSSPVLQDTIWKFPYKLTVDQNYCWKVIVVPDIGDTTIISDSVRFVVVNPPLTPILPLNNSTLKVRRPTFTWNSVNDTSIPEFFTYQVVLSTDSTFNVAETSTVISDTAWKMDHTLDANQIYYWKTIAISDSGDTAFSNAAKFTIAPIPFFLHLPSSTIRVKQPTFAWQNIQDTSITGSYTYRTIVSKTTDFSIAETSAFLTDTIWKVPDKLDLYSTYYWKVESILGGVGSSFNNAANFAVLPPPILPLLPLEATNVRERQPTLVWSTVQDTSIPDTFLYRVLISKEDFSNEIVSPVQSDTTWQVTSPLQAGTIYVWKPMALYSNDDDTIFPDHSSFFRELPSRIIIPEDRPRIQEGIDLVLDGDTVWVKPGIYYENIFFKGKRVKVISEAGPESTTIAKYVDGLELVNFSTSEDTNTVLSGFTITGANRVSNGAAIKVVNASPLIENNHIVGNSGDAGAIWILNGFPKIRRNLMAKDTGAAAILYSGPSGGEVINCTISDNPGDGIRVTPGIPIRVTNCIITFNSGYGMRSTNGSNLTSIITYDDVFGNGLGHFFAILPSEGMINADPLFIGGSPFSYHLSGVSPCVDVGDPSFPVPAGGGSQVDMGVFEFILKRGDLNGDGQATPTDVVLELNCVFLASGNCSLAMADLDCDGQITATDVVLELNAVFLSAPLPC